MYQNVPFVLLLLTLCMRPYIHAESEPELTGPDDHAAWRFSFGNDIFWESDDFLSAGWSIERHSPVFQTWDDMGISSFSQWVVGTLPGLSRNLTV